jgi:hypothetical protein
MLTGGVKYTFGMWGLLITGRRTGVPLSGDNGSVLNVNTRTTDSNATRALHGRDYGETRTQTLSSREPG